MHLADLATHMAEVDCFMKSECDYNKYLTNKTDAKKSIPVLTTQLDQLIDEITLRNSDYLGPDEFYNLIVAAVEINRNKV